MSVLACDDCGERYDALALVTGEPCPKVACDGTLEAEGPAPGQGALE